MTLPTLCSSIAVLQNRRYATDGKGYVFGNQGDSRNLNTLLAGDAFRFGEESSFNGLTLIPLFKSRRAPFDYVVLAHAIQSGVATFKEVGRGTVSTLRLINSGDKPILLLEGEHLVGVQQNRILNTTILVPERSTLDIPVSCVEQGRWSAPIRAAEPISPHLFLTARERLAEAVTVSVRSTGLRGADQGAIWQAITTRLFELCADSPTSAMEAIYAQRSSEIRDYLKTLDYREGQTGVVAAIGGRIRCCDLFDRPEVLRGLWDRLISSYAVDAMVQQQRGRVGADEAKAFLWEASQTTITSHPALGRGTDLRLTSDRIVGSALEAEETVIHAAIFRRGAYLAGGGNHQPPEEMGRPSLLLDRVPTRNRRLTRVAT